HDAVPELIAHLDDQHPRVRMAARQALQQLTGTVAGSTADGWRTWLEREEAWLSTADLDERLESDDVGVVGAALRDVAAHAHVAGQHLSAVAALLGHEQAAIRRLACATLTRLGRLEAAPRLARALDDEDPTVVAAAAAALAALGAEQHEPSRRAWEAALAA
ncbi:MAG: HEAT repeat domain-containing protein, partial [Planctomycetota bacterium]|nr:HEAT repeat domain-containing protein [Planctomycetota bacterium]